MQTCRRVELLKPARPEQLLCKLLPSTTCALRGSDFDLLMAWLFPPLPALSRVPACYMYSVQSSRTAVSLHCTLYGCNVGTLLLLLWFR